MQERRYKIGANRRQGMLMPPSIEDYMSETNLVRAIDAYVDTLDMAALGFAYTDTWAVRWADSLGIRRRRY
jgi:hypothetical protein